VSVEIGLNDDARANAADAVAKVLGETYALYVKTHGYHWNVTGPRFRALHNMFEEQYRDLWAALDELAERIRALGHFAPGSSAEMMNEATITPDNGVPDAEAMIANLARGHEVVSRVAKSGIEMADAARDVVTADLLTRRADASEKTAWMLRASL